MNYKLISRIRILFFSLLVFLIFKSILEFEPWSQILYFSEIDLSYTELNRGLLAHLPRYTIIYPTYFISNFFNIKLNLIYSLYILSLLFSTSIIWQKIAIIYSNSRTWILITSLIPLILIFLINGRFAFGLFGLSIIILQSTKRLYRNEEMNFFLDGLGIYFTTISSGTFFCGLIIFFTVNAKLLIFSSLNEIIRLSNMRFHRIKTINTLFLLILSILSIVFFTIFLDKNLEYYGGLRIETISGILSHGISRFLVSEILINYCLEKYILFCDVASLLLTNKFLLLTTYLMLFILIILIFQLFKSAYFNYLAKLTIFSSLVSGLFGITALLSIFILIPQLEVNFKEKKS